MPTRVTGSEKLRIVVLGYIIRGPLGGMIWHHLQYVLGLVRLGHDVYFLEDSDDYPSCYDPEHGSLGTDPAFGLAFIERAFARFGLEGRWGYFDAHSNSWFGCTRDRAETVCADADILLNLSAVNPLRPWSESVPRRVFVDTDPVFTQIRHLQDSKARALAEGHTAFFSFGENIGAEDCLVPDDGFPWQPTRQPIVLDAWPATPADRNAPWTTVMQWDSYRVLEQGGRHFGMKSESFEPYLNLPRASGQKFDLAVGGVTAPRALLAVHGWTVRNPQDVIRSPWDYQTLIQGSKGEWTVAKHGYVAGRSGWFSERSAAYLASGRPVITQDTGFSRWLPVGEGLLSFGSTSEALSALEAVESDYETHCRQARAIAASCFASDGVLISLIDRVLTPITPAPAR